MNEKNETNVLYARLEDLCLRCEKGIVGITSFLSPRELALSQDRLRAKGASFFSYGGYEEAERKRIYILPEYFDGAENISAFEEFGYSAQIDALFVSGSGFEKLSHRAVMGSVLALGIERDVVGDIVMTDEQSAVVFCDSAISPYLLSELKRVGRDTVKIKRAENVEIIPKREFVSLSDTVASPRLDCIVAALCLLSREKARQTVEEGLAELDYKTEQRPDREVAAPCILSVRGYGKFRVLSVDEKTKKGRYRLLAEKFV